jgi:hypothetical protein
MNATKIKFKLGRVVATPGALAVLEESNQTAIPFIIRHQTGDWGSEVCEDDKKLNDEAEGGCEATDGCWVEPDGVCEHGCKSWLIVLGVI